MSPTNAMVEARSIEQELKGICRLALQYKQATRDGHLTVTQARMLGGKMAPLIARAKANTAPTNFIENMREIAETYKEIRCVSDAPEMTTGFLSNIIAMLITVSIRK